jgi:aminoglycoside/choline kinase family phosphotransferase
MESINARKNTLAHWLMQQEGLPSFELQAMPGDASLRRYYRISAPTGSYVAMDAPPPQENCAPFVAIAKALRGLDLQTPEIIAADVDQGFLLLSDFGDLTYLQALSTFNPDLLYQQALKALVVLQSCRAVPGREIPPFTSTFMLQEWAWHKEWFLGKLLGLTLGEKEAALDHEMQAIVQSAANQPQVFMHRDFHSANLMLLPHSQVGILDFQDAFIGPVTYDLVSLLRDCYIDWPVERVQQWVTFYWQQLTEHGYLSDISLLEFIRWFDWMGVQRHLKALFTFSRKHVRDHQSHYLQHVPRTLNYIVQVTAAYPELKNIHQYYSQIVQPAFQKGVFTCAQ